MNSSSPQTNPSMPGSSMPPNSYQPADGDFDSQGAQIGDSAALRMILPVGRSLWAILAGYLGLFSVLLIPAPFAVLFGFLAIREIRRNPQKHGMGRAVFGIVFGGLAMGLAAIVWVIAMFGAQP